MPVSHVQSKLIVLPGGARPGSAGPRSDRDDDAHGEDPGDLEAIYRRHADAVATWAQRLGGPDVELEDIVHDVFLVVQRRLPEWRGEARITTWLYEITLRVVQQRRRRMRWLRWLPGRGADVPGDGLGGDDLADLASDQSGPHDLLERREASQTLYRILDGIGEKYRTVVILFELEGFSGEQIATITGTSLANVWIRLHRARQKMVKRLRTLALRGRL
jgi:RNA polymerase sigma-70 factor (ECF subfamily)